jgi:hypothetical protein
MTRGHPGPADNTLIMEIADSGPTEDGGYAVDLYGPAGIPIRWIVEVQGHRVEAGPAPRALQPRQSDHRTRGQRLTSAVEGADVGNPRWR